MKNFDKKFGRDFFSSIPATPGVYRVFNASGELVYVGKAKNLKRRLGQYRNAKRCKKHRKMRSIIQDAARIEFETCPSDLDACLLETQLIQQLRPKWNVAGAFYFLYPLLGVKLDPANETAAFCYTTTPEKFPEFEFFGAYRSRFLTGEAFFSLMKLLTYVGHRQNPRARREKYSYVFEFRRISEVWHSRFRLFFKGSSLSLMEELVLALVEHASARRDGKAIQEHINHLKRFWRLEAMPLRKAIEAFEVTEYPLPQRARDTLFLKYRMKPASKSRTQTPGAPRQSI